MPIVIQREQVQRLADAAAVRHGLRQTAATDLRTIFAPTFDATAWLAVCEAAVKTGEWSGALFNLDEPVNQSLAFGDVPQQYVLLSADGSQILPNRHSFAHYYFLQAATACIVYGVDPKSEALLAAEAISKKSANHLEFDDKKLYDDNGELISGGAIANKRDVLEIELLAERCRLFAEAGMKPIAVADGSIVPFALLNPNFLRDRKSARELSDRIAEALNVMRKAGAVVAGYIDRPDSNAMVRAARLAHKSAHLINKQSLRQLEEGALPMSDFLSR